MLFKFVSFSLESTNLNIKPHLRYNTCTDRFQHSTAHFSSLLPRDPGAGLRELAVGQTEAQRWEDRLLLGQVPRGRVLCLHRPRHLRRHRHACPTHFPGTNESFFKDNLLFLPAAKPSRSSICTLIFFFFFSDLSKASQNSHSNY